MLAAAAGEAGPVPGPGHGAWPRLQVNKTQSLDQKTWVSLIMALEEFTGFIITPVYSWSHLERGLKLQTVLFACKKCTSNIIMYVLCRYELQIIECW